MFTEKYSKAAAWIAIVAGALAIIIGVIGGIIGESRIFTTNLLLSLLIALMGLLCAGLGAERLGPMERLINATQNIGRLRWLSTGAEVYQMAEGMVAGSPDNSEIKATDLYPSPSKTNSREFESHNAVLAKRIGEAVRKNKSVNYHLIFADNPDDKNDGNRDGMEAQKRRRELLKTASAKVREHIHFRYIRHPFPLEVLIVGSDVLLGFPTTAGGRPLGAGVLIHDEESARRFEDWYEHHLWDKATETT